MFQVVKYKEKEVRWTFAKCGVFELLCYGNSEDAERKAKDFVFNVNEYSIIRGMAGDILTVSKDYELNGNLDIDKIDKDGKYVAHWLAHRVYIICKKVREIDGEDGKVTKVFQSLIDRHAEQSHSNNSIFKCVPSSLHTGVEASWKILNMSIKEALLILSKIGDNCSIVRASMEERRISINKDIDKFIKDLYKMHSGLSRLADVLAEACKIEEVQKDPSLGTKVCKLYKEMECFLDRDCRIEKEEYDRILEVAEKAEAQEKINSWVKDAKRIVDLLGGLDKSNVKQEDWQALLISCATLVMKSQQKKDEQADKQLERADSSRSLDMIMDTDSRSTEI